MSSASNPPSPSGSSAPRAFDYKDTSTYTLADLTDFFSKKTGQVSKQTWKNFYGWSEDEYKTAKQIVTEHCNNLHMPVTGRLVTKPGSDMARMRRTIQTNLVNNTPHLFRDRHQPNPPAWFHTTLVNGITAVEDDVELKIPPQLFIAAVIKERQVSMSQAEGNHRTQTINSDDEEQSVRPPKRRRMGESSSAPSSSQMGLQSPSGLTNPMSDANLSEADTVSLGPRTPKPFRTPAASKLPLDDMFLYIVKVKAIDGGSSVQLDRDNVIPISSLGSSSDPVYNWKAFSDAAFEPYEGSPLTPFYFEPLSEADTPGDNWRIKNQLHLTSAIKKTYLAFDPHRDPTGIQVFMVNSREDLDLIPLNEISRCRSFAACRTMPARMRLTTQSLAIQQRALPDHNVDTATNEGQLPLQTEELQTVDPEQPLSRTEEPQTVDPEQPLSRTEEPQTVDPEQPLSRTEEPQTVDLEQPTLPHAGNRQQDSSDETMADVNANVHHNVEEQHPPIRSADTTLLPFYVPQPYDQSKAKAQEGPLKPSVEVSAGKWRKSMWLSTASQLSQYNASDGTISLVTAGFKAHQHSEKNWTAICRFYGFDDTDPSPKSGVWLPGWNEKRHITAYQMYTAGWVVKGLLMGRNFVIIGHEMGLGKTCMAVAVLVSLHNLALIDQHKAPTALNNTHADYFSAERLLDEHGELPLVRAGPALVLAPGSVLDTWASEIRRFVKSGIKVVIAWGNMSKARMTASYPGCYLIDDVVRDEDMPSEEWLEATYKSQERPKPFRVRDLLEPNGYREPEAQASGWWVLTTPDTLKTRFTTKDHATGKEHQPNAAAIDAAWAYVVLDEFHKYRSWKHSVWTILGRLRGAPQFVYLSGTILNKTRDLVGPALAAEAFAYKPLGHRSIVEEWQSLDARKVEALSRELNWKPNTRLTEDDKEFILKHGVRAIASLSTRIDRLMAKNNKLSDADASLTKDGSDSGSDSDGLNQEMTDVVKDLLQQFSATIQPYLIQYHTEHWWKPFTTAPGYPAVDIAPHSTFDILVPLPKAFKDSIRPEWLKVVDSAYRKTQIGGGASINERMFFGYIHVFRTYTVFPCLFPLRTAYTKLDKEINRCTRSDAERILKLGDKSVIWEHMEAIHALPTMQVARELLEGLRRQQNYINQPRKLIFVSFTPFVAALFQLYLQWLVRRADYLMLQSEADIAFVASWHKAEDRSDVINLFKTVDDTEHYVDKPGVLNALASTITVGLSLNPADAVIMLDAEWDAAKVAQSIARIRRASFVQKANVTEAYRIISSSKWCCLQTWMAQRQESVVSIQELVKGAIEDSSGGDANGGEDEDDEDD